MFHRKRALLEATRLTRNGRLGEAMAVIQGTLQGRDMSDRRPDPAPGDTPSLLERADAALRKTPWAGAMDGLQGLSPLGGASSRSGLDVPTGARFEDRSFSGPAGSRRGSLYVPSTLESAPALLVMLHGCTQSPEDFAVGTRMNDFAERHGFLVLYPRQPQSANPSRCWNWFQPDDQDRGRGEPAIIAAMVEEVAGEFVVDRARVFAAGLSAGGSEAAILGAGYPELFSAIGVHSGLAWRSASDVVTAFSAMRQGSPQVPALPSALGRRPRLIVFHGDRDATVHPINADQVFAQGADVAELRCETRESAAFSSRVCFDARDRSVAEQWTVHGSGHAWSGGSSAGSHTDPNGPDASAEMVRFFLN